MGKTVLADIRNNQFPALTIEEGTFVVWRNLDPVPHSAETLLDKPDYFNGGPLHTGELSSPILFSKAGKFDYVCRFHANMTGTVTVVARGGGSGSVAAPVQGGHGGHGHGGLLQHLHGFVTGGRSSNRLFMTHTPVLADDRHRFQVILLGSFPDKAHAAAYDAMRKTYGDGKVQIFHEHISLVDIGSGKLTTLPKASTEYYPHDKDGILGGEPIPGLEQDIPVRIDKVIHFHHFAVDADYPDALTYIVYGDADDVFVDHYIDRAPSFHSVAKLKARPAFFPGTDPGASVKISVPSKSMRDTSPKVLRRVAVVDNAFHVFWLPPPGVYARPLAQDPLIRRDKSAPVYAVTIEGGGAGQIEIGRFLHFDVRLLNYGVLIV